MEHQFNLYAAALSKTLTAQVMQQVAEMGQVLLDAWRAKKQVYLCGNGGSAANAIHLANDLIYGAGVGNGGGLRAEALSANTAVLSCLANDIGYEHIFAEQLRIKGQAGDVLIVFSGSGNSPNVVKAIEQADQLAMHTLAVVGYSGGKCKQLAQRHVHFVIDDMQIAEDLQLIVGHICIRWLQAHASNCSTMD